MTRTRFVAVLAMLALPATAAAAPAVSGEFEVGGTPRHLTLGPDGNVWVALQAGDGTTVAKVAPDGTVTNYKASDATGEEGIVTGPDHNLWMTASGNVVRFSPSDPVGTAQKFPVAEINDPRGISVGPDGNLWTASGDHVIKITTAGVATAVQVTDLAARGAVAGTDGRIYVGDFVGGLVSMKTDQTDIKHIPIPVTNPTDNAGTQEVGPGKPGGPIMSWSASTHDPQQLGIIDAAGLLKSVDMPAGTDPTGITIGDDGAWWRADFASSDLSRQTADLQVTRLTGLTAGSGPRQITTGTGGTLWVSEETALKVAKITGVNKPIVNPPPPPPKDTTAPKFKALKVTGKVKRGKAPTISFNLSEAATVSLKLQRYVTKRKLKLVLFRSLKLKAGKHTIKLKLSRHRKFRLGRYKLTLTAKDAAGNVKKLTRTLKVVKR